MLIFTFFPFSFPIKSDMHCGYNNSSYRSKGPGSISLQMRALSETSCLLMDASPPAGFICFRETNRRLKGRKKPLLVFCCRCLITLSDSVSLFVLRHDKEQPTDCNKCLCSCLKDEESKAVWEGPKEKERVKMRVKWYENVTGGV